MTLGAVDHLQQVQLPLLEACDRDHTHRAVERTPTLALAEWSRKP